MKFRGQMHTEQLGPKSWSATALVEGNRVSFRRWSYTFEGTTEEEAVSELRQWARLNKVELA